jgi:iron complex outermembrane receptor protein
MLSKSFMVAAALLSTTFPMAVALAGEDDEELSVEEQLFFSEEELVSSASKKVETVTEAPAFATVITRDDIRRYGYRNLAEALRRVPGLYANNDLSWQYLGIRGFARPEDYNTRFLVMIDGHRLNDPIWDYGPIGEDLPIDIESIERIEVVKGPGSALWGTNSLLGVINIITRKGSDIDGGRVAGEIGTHDRAKGFVELGKKFDNGLEIAGSISALDSDGRNRIYFPEFDDPSTNNGVVKGLDGTAAARGYLSASYQGLRFLFVKGQRKKDIPTASYLTAFNEPGTKARGDITFTELSYETGVLEEVNGKLFLRAYHDWREDREDYAYDEGDPILLVNRDHVESRLWGSEVRLYAEPSSRMSLTTGIEYMDAYNLQLKNYDDDPWFWQYLDINDSFELFSFYLQADIELLDDLRLVAGARLDDYSTFGDHTSPRAALIYTPFEPSTVKLLYGEAFRAPNLYERAYFWPGEILANPDLEPEVIETWELVWEQKVAEHTRLAISAFRFEIDDLIDNVEVQPWVTQYQNRGKVRSHGGELMLESRFGNDITGYVGATVLEAKDKDTRKRLTNSPDFIANGGISIPLWNKKLYVTPELRYVDERKTLGGNRTDSAVLANLSLSTGTLLPYKVSFNIYNVFDESYHVPGSGGSALIQDGIPQDGRTFRLQVAYEF